MVPATSCQQKCTGPELPTSLSGLRSESVESVVTDVGDEYIANGVNPNQNTILAYDSYVTVCRKHSNL